jgi:hypothetical protein
MKADILVGRAAPADNAAKYASCVTIGTAGKHTIVSGTLIGAVTDISMWRSCGNTGVTSHF